ncbi:DUF3617 domain-containing protein [Enterovibrio sp. ZSDZ42]|uniref:DUF3617 domain-containing protein n=1 Tax=Enterovibrio gelatinilyticus TaxID=2899819 RepID=A0ABT5R5C7_9GAMM|nr:DUF3617 domain-containing protein [Enterovibrio sp. ZSDZ42]MDD1795194.1 DUF3617 domain-containing protein [Enterovibrio sp. ZSDZ42]
MTSLMNISVFTALILASSHLRADSYDFKPGLWENSSTIEIIEIDAPPEAETMMRSTFERGMETETVCYKSLDYLLELDADQEFVCKKEIKRISANKMELEESCTGTDMKSKTVGEVNLNGKTLTSTSISEFETPFHDGPIKIKLKVVSSGKYIGACN